MTNAALEFTRIVHKTPATLPLPLPPTPAKVKPESGTTWSGPRRRRTRGIPAIAVTLLALAAVPAPASTVTVPDDSPTIQQAIDSGADTVLVREGDYSESPEAYRGITLQGLGPRRPRLAGLAISNPYWWLSLSWDVSGIDFTGPITLTTSNWQARYLGIAFDRCALPGGIQHDILAATDPYDIGLLSVSHCQLGGGSIASAARVSMVSDTIASGVTLVSAEAVNVQSCWFTGGSGAALTLQDQEPSGLIESNVIEGYDTGIAVVNSNGLTIRNNVVRDMTEFGIGVRGHAGTVIGNSVTGCQTGIICSIEDIVLNDNVILHSRGMGVLLYSPTDVQAQNNVIGRCGDVGLFIESGGNGNFILANNTLFENANSGVLVWHGSNNRLTLHGNIFYANTGWGLQTEPLTSITFSCNDWFANGLGAVTGAQASDSDFAVDPGFCDVASDDVRLYANSPLADSPGCGLVGALGVGCDLTATLVRRFGAERVAEGVRIAWELSESSGSRLAWLERSDDGEPGPWTRPTTEVTHQGLTVIELDRTASTEHAHWYRLVASEAGVMTVLGAPIRVEALYGSAFRLALVGPSPSRGPVRIEFELGTQAAIELEVFDVQGRLVASPARGVWPAGRHAVEWSGLRDGGRLHSGIYLIRYRFPGGEARRRVVRTS